MTVKITITIKENALGMSSRIQREGGANSTDMETLMSEILVKTIDFLTSPHEIRSSEEDDD